MILIDTSVIVEILKGNQKIIDFLKSKKEEIYITSVTLAEVTIGFYFKSRKYFKTHKSYFEELLEKKLIKIIPFDERIALTFAKMQASLKRSGKVLADFDAVIAATSLFFEATLITLDEDFKRVKGLKLLFPGEVEKHR
ncbi:MAG: type II toxin-antitoxin system VapC family toxin [Microgenomates group bacterium]